MPETSLWKVVCISGHLGVFYKSLLLAFVVRHRLSENLTAAANTRNYRRIVGLVVFYAVRVMSKESRRLVLFRPSCLSTGIWNDSRVFPGAVIVPT